MAAGLLDPAELVVLDLPSGLDSAFGQTVVLRSSGRWAVLAKSGASVGLEVVPLRAAEPLRLETSGFDAVLVVARSNGREHRVRVPAGTVERFRQALETALPAQGSSGDDPSRTATLEAVPRDPASYRALRRHFTEMGDLDRAWCACQVLVFLGKASEEERRAHRRHAPDGSRSAKVRLLPEHWKLLCPPSYDHLVSAFFAVIARAAARVNAKPRRDYGLKKRDARDIAADSLRFSRVLYRVATLMNVPLPEVHLEPERTAAILLANVSDGPKLVPVWVVGCELLQGRSEAEIAFAVARKLALMIPEHYLRLATTTKIELAAAFHAALALAGAEHLIPAEARGPADQYLPHLRRRLSPGEFEQAAEIARRIAAAKRPVDLVAWARAVDTTSCRAAHLITGDLAVAHAMLSSERRAVGDPDVPSQLDDLLRFTVSEQHAAIRRYLGWAVGGST